MIEASFCRYATATARPLQDESCSDNGPSVNRKDLVVVRGAAHLSDK